MRCRVGRPAALFGWPGWRTSCAREVSTSSSPGPARAGADLDLASGVAELGLAAGYAVPATRRATSRVAAAFLVAVWPANAQMAVDAWRSGSTRARVVTTARLPLQVPLVRLALRGGA